MSTTEVYSPKRVTATGELMGLTPGRALDLTETNSDGEPWEFNVESKRQKAMEMVQSKKALLLI